MSGSGFTAIDCDIIMFWLTHPPLSLILVIIYVVFPTTVEATGILVTPLLFIGPLDWGTAFAV